MGTAANGPDPGDTAAWLARERAFRAFEEAWQRGERPAIEDHLPDGAHRGPALLELARIDLEYRLRAGEAARVEDYLARYPELARDARAAVELVLVEYRQRPKAGTGAELAEYLQRFPGLATALAQVRPPSLGAAPPDPAETSPALPRGPGEATGAAPFPRVPGYELLGELGRGGMGVVYKARQVSLNRLVALKTVRGGPGEEPEHLARLLAEARAVACLQHPNIVQIYEVGEQGGFPYLALELVESGSLERKLGGSPQAPRWAADLARVLARAVHAAHQAGVVHRDLKPANILLTADGAPKVTDFGLAKRLEAGPGRTQSGAILGTPSYMAPEQAQGRTREIGPATDVYALGGILYEVLTGRPPFRAETPLDTMLLVIAEEPVPPRRLQPGVPRDLETVCLKCLQKDPRKRYPTALALADDLGRFLEGQPVSARPAPPWERLAKWTKRRPGLAALAAVSLLAALLLTAGGLWSNQALREAAAREGRRAGEAEKAEADARQALDNSRERLVRLYLASGARRADEGDLLGALPWYTEALRLDEGDPAREEAHRRRLAAVLRDCPSLLQVWVQGTAAHAEFSSDGRQVIIADGEHAARVWDVSSGQAVTPPLRHDTRAGAVVYASFSPDGRRVVTATADLYQQPNGEARVWDVATGEPVTPVLAHQGAVVSAAFSPDGRRLATASRDRTARVWDAASGKPLGPPLRHDRPLAWVAFSPDGRLLTRTGEPGSANPGGEVRLWHPDTGKLALPPFTHPDRLNAASLSPDGRWLATASGQWNLRGAEGEARVWDAATGAPVTPPLKHKDAVIQVAFSPDGRRLLTVCANMVTGDGELRVWDASAGTLLTPPWRAPAGSGTGSFSPDGRFILAATGVVGQYGEAQIWDAATGRRVLPPLKHTFWMRTASFSPDGHRVLTATSDGTVRVWDVARCDSAATVMRHAHWVHDVRFSPDGRRLVTASRDGSARVWDAASGRALTPPLRHGDAVVSASFSPDGRRVLTASRDKTARIWDAASGKALGAPLNQPDQVRHAEFSPDGGRVLTAGWRDHRARVWDATTGLLVAVFQEHTDMVYHAAFSPDGRRVVSASEDKTARVWDAATGRPLTPPLTHDNGVMHAEFSPDGRYVITASGDRSARVWDAATGEPASPLLKHSGGFGRLTWAAFSPDGRRVVTAGYDGVARVWDPATGTTLTPPLKHRSAVTRASFSPDGRWLLTCSGEVLGAGGEVRVWDARTGDPVTPPLGPGQEMAAATWSPDGRRIAAAGWDNTARVWDLPLDERPVTDLSGLAHVLSAHTIDETGGFVPMDKEALARAWQELRSGSPRELAPPSSAEVLAWHRREAEEALAQRQWWAAAWHLSHLLDAEPGDATALRDRARTYLEQGEGAKAVADYDRAVALGAADAEVWHSRGRAHAQLGNHDKALEDLDHALAGSPEPGAVWLSRCFADARAGQRGRAAEDYRKALEATNAVRVSEEILWGERPRGVRREGSASWEAVAGDFSRALEKEPSAGWLWRGRGLAQAALGQYDKALADFSRAAELDPEDAEAWRGRARLHAESEQWAEVVTDCTKALALEKGDSNLWFLLGLAHGIRQEFPKAATAFDKAIALGPPGWVLWTESGYAHRMLGQWERTVADSTRAIELKPGVWHAWYNRALAQAALGRWDGAAADFDEVLRLNPDHAWSYYGRGDVHARRGRWEKAVADFARAAQLDPGTPEFSYREADARLGAADLAGHRRVCEAMLARFGSAQDPQVASQVLYTCVVVPESVPDATRLLRLAAIAPPAWRGNVRIQGASLYRAGEPAKAVERFQEAAKVFPPRGWDWLFLAMSQHRLGRDEAARDSFNRALIWIEDAERSGGMHWTERLETEALRREADALLRTQRLIP